MILVTKAKEHASRCAIVDKNATYSYQNLLDFSALISHQLLCLKPDYQNVPIAFLMPAQMEYLAVQWGIWRTGAIAVPIALSHPPAEIAYILEDTQTEIVFVYADLLDKITPHPYLKIIEIKPCFFQNNIISYNYNFPEITPDFPALMIYTSGTTHRPKGVIMTHANLQAQIENLVELWDWKSDDYILNVLPLHHVHGLVNVLCCALYVGATCEMHQKFDAQHVWHTFLERKLTLFMAVPTIYNRLIQYWEHADNQQQKRFSEAVSSLRLMVSGSAALPAIVLEKWQKITKHILLERYGMTEIGMALSNPLNGKRKAGFVGKPLPHFQIRLVDEQGNDIAEPFQSAEIQVKSPTVFREYWRKPQATQNAFTADGWFMTGDIAEMDEDGDYKILGRKSQDIIKTGGFKVSALEIESVLLNFVEIQECAVVALPDADLGEKIAVAFVSDFQDINTQKLREKTKTKLAHYKTPVIWKQVDKLPRNAMGKIQKPNVKNLFLRPTIL